MSSGLPGKEVKRNVTLQRPCPTTGPSLGFLNRPLSGGSQHNHSQTGYHVVAEVDTMWCRRTPRKGRGFPEGCFKYLSPRGRGRRWFVLRVRGDSVLESAEPPSRKGEVLGRDFDYRSPLTLPSPARERVRKMFLRCKAGKSSAPQTSLKVSCIRWPQPTSPLS